MTNSFGLLFILLREVCECFLRTQSNLTDLFAHQLPDAEITGVEGLDSDSPLQMSETEYEEELEACEEEERESQETEEVPPPYHPA